MFLSSVARYLSSTCNFWGRGEASSALSTEDTRGERGAYVLDKADQKKKKNRKIELNLMARSRIEVGGVAISIWWFYRKGWDARVAVSHRVSAKAPLKR